MHEAIRPAQARWQFGVGERLPIWQIVAENDATDSGNPMHDDARARALGFAGGLVPGVTLYGYLMHPLVSLFGAAFLQRGVFEARFRRPVYAGEMVSTHIEITAAAAASTRFALELRNAAGDVCVIGSAEYRDTDSALALEIPAIVEIPAERRPATPEALRANPVLGTLHEIFSATQSAEFVASMGDRDSALYETVVHPAWLLRQANLIVDRNLAVGPWIHVSSHIRHAGTIRLGEGYTVHARAVELSTRKGHDYADFEVVMATTRPVLSVLHRAIYRMGA